MNNKANLNHFRKNMIIIKSVISKIDDMFYIN